MVGGLIVFIEVLGNVVGITKCWLQALVAMRQSMSSMYLRYRRRKSGRGCSVRMWEWCSSKAV